MNETVIGNEASGEKLNPRERYLKAINNEPAEAFAFDLDGSAYGDGQEIKKPIKNVLSYLSRGNIPQIVVTGRSEAHTNKKFLDEQYIVPDNLFIINANGALVRKFEREENGEVKEIVLHRAPFGKAGEIFEKVSADERFQKWFNFTDQGFTSKPLEFAVRLALKENLQGVVPTSEQIEEILEELGFPKDVVQAAFTGKSFDLMSPEEDKDKALNIVATSLGIDPDTIVRADDHGEKGGNGWKMLQHKKGFTLGESDDTNPEFCHPVVNDKGEVLRGDKAFYRLVRDINWKERFLRPGKDFNDQRIRGQVLQEYKAFEEGTRKRFENQSSLFESEIVKNNNLLNAEEIKDKAIGKERLIRNEYAFTGAVMLSDEELQGLPEGPLKDWINTPAKNLSEDHTLEFRYRNKEGGTNYCRSEAFYEAMMSKDRTPAERLALIQQNFLELNDKRQVIQNFLENNKLSVAEYKVALSYFDHYKQSLTQILHSYSFLKARGLVTDEHDGINEGLRDYLIAGSNNLYEVLEMQKPQPFVVDGEFINKAFNATSDALNKLSVKNEKLAGRAIRTQYEDHPYYNAIFGQVAAAKLAGIIPEESVFAGLHLGGAELPYVVSRYIQKLDPSKKISYTGVHFSRYGNLGVEDVQDKTQLDSISDREVDVNGKTVVLFDDMTHTGKSLFRSGLVFVTEGASVLFCTQSLVSTRDVGLLIEAGGIEPEVLKREVADTSVRVAAFARTTNLEDLKKARKKESNLIKRYIRKIWRS